MNYRLVFFAVLPILALALIGAVAGGPGAPRAALAAIDCDDEHRLRIDFFDDETDDLLTVAGTSVRVDPDPRDGNGTRLYVDNGSNDEEGSTTGRIHEEDACDVTDMSTPTAYTITVESLPANCDVIGDASQMTTLTQNQTVTFHVDNCLEDDDVDLDISPDRRFLDCSERTDINVRVEIEGVEAADGTDVDFSTDRGSLSPSSEETVDGEVEVEYRAPSSSGGTATIYVTVLGITETTTISIGCNVNVGPANLGFPQASCRGNSADVTFYWGPNNGGTQFLDLTLYDNNFAGGTFVNTNGLSSSTDRYTWDGLIAGIPHYLRINTLTDAGWVTSATGTFVPCGGPQIRGITYACIGGGRAAVTFHWSPSTPSGRTTWLDLSVFNNGFGGGTFANAGPMVHDWLNWTWIGVGANQTHYWRVSTLFGNNWDRSSTGSFVAFC
ncbi:MAG: hypothetical protein GEU75_00480 [Dehalococcoidia bacterium]|nr:hypothetical protein [Dehalococcoidia bacterium]